jgi:hypothetical protein
MKPKKPSPDCKPAPGNNRWVLGAGGWYIFFHLGVLKAADELGLAIEDSDEVLGVSCGALTAAFVKNGYKWDDIARVFLEMRDARLDPANWMLMYNPFADPLTLSLGGYFSLKRYMDHLVAKYNLKPQKGLRILACDILRHEPVIFEGENYDLAFALTASGAVPGLVQPLWYMQDGQPKLLVDGAVHHYSPTEFTCGSAIVSKFRRSTQMPTPPNLASLEDWFYFYFAMREHYFPLVGNNRYVDEAKHIVIETGFPDLYALNAKLSEETCWKMVDSGYNTAKPIFQKAIAEGRVTVRAKSGKKPRRKSE